MRDAASEAGGNWKKLLTDNMVVAEFLPRRDVFFGVVLSKDENVAADLLRRLFLPFFISLMQQVP